MRSPARSITALALAALTLGACTSGEDPSETSTPDAAPSSAPAVTDGSDSNGWLCEDVSPETLRAVAGGELGEPNEVMVQDDETAWVCDAYDGDTPLVRLSLAVGEEARDEARSRMQSLEGVTEGPDYLGESYSSPGVVAGLTACTDMDQPGAGVYEPYTMVAESLTGDDADVSDQLRSTLTGLARRLDQGIGCSPKQARGEADAGDTTSGPTEAP